MTSWTQLASDWLAVSAEGVPSINVYEMRFSRGEINSIYTMTTSPYLYITTIYSYWRTSPSLNKLYNIQLQYFRAKFFTTYLLNIPQWHNRTDVKSPWRRRLGLDNIIFIRWKQISSVLVQIKLPICHNGLPTSTVVSLHHSLESNIVHLWNIDVISCKWVLFMFCCVMFCYRFMMCNSFVYLVLHYLLLCYLTVFFVSVLYNVNSTLVSGGVDVFFFLNKCYLAHSYFRS